MKKLIQIFIFFGFIVMIGGSATGQEEGNREIVITVTSMEKSKSHYGKKGCDLKFDITNNAYGTINRIDAELTGFDDRGRKVREMMGNTTASNQLSMSSFYTPIALGTTVRDIGDATFKEECKYLTEIKFDGIDNDNCVMRMLPENVSCSKFTILKSNVPSLKIKN